jgi:hypothetical protein
VADLASFLPVGSVGGSSAPDVLTLSLGYAASAVVAGDPKVPQKGPSPPIVEAHNSALRRSLINFTVSGEGLFFDLIGFFERGWRNLPILIIFISWMTMNYLIFGLFNSKASFSSCEQD